jgi:hypothetical protein
MRPQLSAFPMANVFPFLIDVNLPAVHVPYKTILSGEVFANGKNTLNPPFRGCNVGRILYSPAFESAEVWRATEPGRTQGSHLRFSVPPCRPASVCKQQTGSYCLQGGSQEGDGGSFRQQFTLSPPSRCRGGSFLLRTISTNWVTL